MGQRGHLNLATLRPPRRHDHQPLAHGHWAGRALPEARQTAMVSRRTAGRSGDVAQMVRVSFLLFRRLRARAPVPADGLSAVFMKCLRTSN